MLSEPHPYQSDDRLPPISDTGRKVGAGSSCGTTILARLLSPEQKSRYNRWTRRHIPGASRNMKLTEAHIFINLRTGKRMILRHFEKMIDNCQAAEHPKTYFYAL